MGGLFRLEHGGTEAQRESIPPKKKECPYSASVYPPKKYIQHRPTNIYRLFNASDKTHNRILGWIQNDLYLCGRKGYIKLNPIA